MTNYSHLSYEDRKNIEDGLNQNKSINQIAKELNRSHSTILREVDRNRKYSEPTSWNNYKINHPNLDLSCERLNHSPYVCNGCKSRSGCRKIRWTYYAREAQKDYEDLIKSCRQGVNLTLEEIHSINETITPLVKKGQTTNHLYINHPDILDFSKSSFYHYIKDGIFEFGPLDFPRIVKYKKRKNSNKRRTRKEREILVNRKYTDFIEFISNYPDLNIVEMDTVEGLQTESDCFLTLLWRKSKFMLIFKLESQTTEEVTRIFKTLQTLISLDTYKNLFQVIFTVNVHEFLDVNIIECIHSTGEYVTHLFFCDPHKSSQKVSIEKNHEFIRYILPKGSSFKNITQENCNLIMNNINSLCRDSLNGKSPYEAMLFLCDEYILKSLSCYYIEPDNVDLSNNLLK
mgnify:CR=1 FL=1